VLLRGLALLRLLHVQRRRGEVEVRVWRDVHGQCPCAVRSPARSSSSLLCGKCRVVPTHTHSHHHDTDDVAPLVWDVCAQTQPVQAVAQRGTPDGCCLSAEHPSLGRHPLACPAHHPRVSSLGLSVAHCQRLFRSDRPLLHIPKSFDDLKALNGLLNKYRDIYPYRIVICYVITYLL